ncbi:hypothetical protein ANCDUO_12146 [Ancylostoma duodenale]|uniref:Uncharacterized protein n=1 Tax=Ancylostoma duodenale TaxID=51022 RepID=A0A0C2GFG9_9BILA|nr:hypothetical protein ANCDUO_12146 [Ancylostoma duodenale]
MKAVGDCHFTVRCSKELQDGSWQTPIVVLSLSICDGNDEYWKNLPVMQSILRSPNGDCIALEDAACMSASRFAFSSLEIMQQASYALFDLELHGPDAALLLRENRITTTELFHTIVTKVQSYGGGLPSSLLLKKMLGYSPSAMHFIDALKQETSHLANLGAVNV